MSIFASLRGATNSADALEEIDGDAAGGLLLLCDHASSRIPAEYGNLGLPATELQRHIAFDIGAGALTRSLAARFQAPAVLTCFSRLLIDPNRGEDDPTLIMRLSDGAVVPGNSSVDAAERERRLARFYRPYHASVARLVDQMLATGRPPTILSIHSFTPVWKGIKRAWHAGVLWDRDPRLALPLLDGLRAEPGLVVGDNEPYGGALEKDTMYRHATGRGLANALLEVRNDLIEDMAGVQEWSERLERIIQPILLAAPLNVVQHHGSDADPNTRQEPTP